MTENDYCLLYDIASKRVTELEKEKADQKDQLTQAKEIIKSLMHTPTGCIRYYDLYKKAEQFLKEIENDRRTEKTKKRNCRNSTTIRTI